MSTKKHILINTHYMPIGGAERALLGLLSVFDYERFDVDLMINRHEGELLDKIPERVNVLPENEVYRLVLGPLSESLKSRNFKIAWVKLYSRLCHSFYRLFCPQKEKKDDFTAFDILWRNAVKMLPDLKDLPHYDAAISFIMPHYVVAEKVRADVKIAWIHTDYKAVDVNAKAELPIWNAYDKIIAISDKTKESFISVFPSLKEKIVTIHNIISEKAIKAEAGNEKPEEYSDSGINILSVGRICYAKNFEAIPEIAFILKQKGLNFKWFILGPGDSTEIKNLVKEKNLENEVILLGSKKNPYPYIAFSDIYVQPSRYEGNCVSVEEAKAMCKPIVLAPYTTAKEQIVNNINGRISKNYRFEEFANDILELCFNPKQKLQFESNLAKSCGTNEINKLYELML